MLIVATVFCFKIRQNLLFYVRPSLFFSSGVSKGQIPLGIAAISQVSSALDAGYPAKLVRCDDMSDLGTSEKQRNCMKKKSMLSMLSMGSFDILDMEDFNAAGN